MSADPAQEFNDSLRGNYLWANTNFGEAVTEVMTPLTWAVIQFTLEDWVFLRGYPTVGNLCGRPYLNISIFATLFSALGRSRQDLLEALEATLYMRLPEALEIPRLPLSRGAVLASLPYPLWVGARQYWGRLHLPAYLAGNRAWFERTRAALQAETSPAGLLRLWQAEMRSHIKGAVWTVLGTVTRASDETMRLRRQLTRLAGPEDANLLIANLNEEASLLPSLGPVVGVAQVASGALSRQEYLAQYGQRGPQEFELSVPRPAEDPAWLDQQLAQFQAAPVDIQALLAQQKEAFAAAWGRFAIRYPSQANAMQGWLRRCAGYARLREQARAEYTRDRWAVRLFALRAGELTGLGQNVFFLMLDELLQVLGGDRAAVERIPARQEVHQRYKALPAYPSIILGPFDALRWAADPQRSGEIYQVAALAAQTAATGPVNVLCGSPGSAGRVEGLARLIYRPEDGDQLQPGEILVTVQTDIAWTLLFPRAAAIVTDVGAPLSHAAIVARELGIPAVVGCREATARLKTGDRILVDGGAGVVEIL